MPELKNIGNKFNAVDLQVRDWRKQLAELVIIRDHLSAEIDQRPGPPGRDLNNLVTRFIDVEERVQRLTSDIQRVTGKGRITR